MTTRKFFAGAALAGALSVPAVTLAHGISAADAAWGLGGIMAGSMYSDHKNKREQQQGGYYTEAVPVAVPVQSTGQNMTVEQKLQQLDKLAAGGYITPAEYKARKQAVLDNSMAN